MYNLSVHCCFIHPFIGTILEESINNTSTTPEDKPDIVGVYAERLSAVTHAFSICCNAKLKSIGK